MKLPIAREGWPFITAPLAAACVLALAGRRRLALAGVVAGAACVGFFRDPERTSPGVPGAVLAPADGKVMDMVEVEDRFVGPAVRLSIFLSPLDVHVNRSPLDAIVQDVAYVRGRFLAAYRPEASEANERCTVALEGDRGRVSVTQIAGVVARRIVCRVRPGDKLGAGERFGLIRFGSRTDLTVPRGTEILARPGDRMIGGESIMALFR